MSEADFERMAIPEERVPEVEATELAREVNSLDRDSFRALEALSLNSFENALNAFEQFLGSLAIFSGANRFVKAANALDVASSAFTAIDANHDFVMTKVELEGYLASCPSAENAQPLAWLIANFAVLQRLSFFQDGISRHEIESARDLFHGLNYLQGNLDKIATGKKGDLSEKDVQNYVREHKDDLETHDARGLRGLAKFLGRLEPVLEDGKGGKRRTK